MGSVGLDAEGRVLVPGLHLLSGNPLQISRQNLSGFDYLPVRYSSQRTDDVKSVGHVAANIFEVAVCLFGLVVDVKGAEQSSIVCSLI